MFSVFRFHEICLRLWQRSKQGYEEFRDSGLIKLPSGNDCVYALKCDNTKI